MTAQNSTLLNPHAGVCHYTVVVRTSRWIRRWLETVQRHQAVSKTSSNLRLLDWASGAGRHSLLGLELGFEVVAVDKDAEALPAYKSLLKTVALDVESEDSFATQEKDAFIKAQQAAGGFDTIVVANYLFRPGFAQLCSLLSPSGMLIYETFAQGNGQFGRPSRDDFLLQDGELFERATKAGLRVLAFESGYTEEPKPAMVQRIAAVRPSTHPWHIDPIQAQ